MPQFPVAEAALRAGVERTTLYRKLQRGEITSIVQESTGAKLIDASELMRLYPEADVISPLELLRNVEDPQDATVADVALLRRQVELHDKRAADLEQQLQQLRRDKDDVIDDLRRRLDGESDERRRLTALLTDQRPVAVPPRRAGFWGRLFGR